MVHTVWFLALLAAPGSPEPRPSPPSPPSPPPAKRAVAKRPVNLRLQPIVGPPPDLAQPRPRKKSRVAPKGRYQTVVIGGLRPAPLSDSHRSVEVLDRQLLLELAPRSTPELLSNVPGVVVQRTNHGGGSPFIRGFTGQQILLMIDGVRLNNATTRYGPNQMLNTVDPFMLRRVEVLRGPGALLYGSDAIGGAVNLFSREPSYVPGARYRRGGSLTSRFSTADRSHLYNAYVWGQIDRVAAGFGGSFKVFNTLVGGHAIGEQRGTGYHEGAWDGAVRVHLTSRWFLKVATSSVRQYDVPRTDRFTPTDFRFFTRQFRDLAYLKLTGSRGRYLRELGVTLSFQSHREVRHRFRVTDDRIEAASDEVTVAGLAFHGRTDLGRWSNLVWGGDLYLDRVRSGAHHESISTGVITPMNVGGFRGQFVDGSTMVQGGVFLYDEVRPRPWLHIHAGGRVAFSHVDIPVDPLADIYAIARQPIQNTPVGPALGLSMVLLPSKHLRLITSVHQGFRAPNLDDYTRVGSEGVAFDLPTSHLAPEKTTTFEVGVKLAWRWLSASLFGHYSLLRDFIARQYITDESGQRVLVDGEPAARRANAARGTLGGLEGFGEIRLPHSFALRAWISWTRGDLQMPLQDPAPQPMRRVSPLQGYVAVRWQRRSAQSRRYWAELAVRWSARQDRLSPGDLEDTRICPAGPTDCAGTPGFAVINVSAGVRMHRWVDLTFRLENLTNQSYKWHGSGVYGPGLSATAELRLRY
jgi:outer membrane receptor protein involved in Fe transport